MTRNQTNQDRRTVKKRRRRPAGREAETEALLGQDIQTGTLREQAAQLGDERLSAEQRRDLANQIGQRQGHHYLQNALKIGKGQGNLHLQNVVTDSASSQVQRQSISRQELRAIRRRYEERIRLYREYYANPKYARQERYFGKAIVKVIIAIKERLTEFQNPRWIDRISDFLQKRWLLGVQGAPAFEARYGLEALRRIQDTISSDMWAQALRAASIAERDPGRFDTNAEQRAAAASFPQDIRDALEELKGGDAVFDDDKEYATYLQTIAHDYIDLSDAMIACGCGSEQDWHLLIDILTDESAEGDWATNAAAWMGDVSGVADEAFENFITLTMKRATRLAMERNRTNLVCPDID